MVVFRPSNKLEAKMHDLLLIAAAGGGFVFGAISTFLLMRRDMRRLEKQLEAQGCVWLNGHYEAINDRS